MAATILRLSLLTAFFLPTLNMANDRPLTVDDLLALESVGNPKLVQMDNGLRILFRLVIRKKING